MNRRVILNTVGKIVQLEAVLLLLPLLVAVGFGEWKTVMAFAITMAVAFAVSTLLILTTKHGDRRIFARGGLVSVALSWITLSLIGALPFVLSGGMSSYVDAVFETVSGFTTTGASVLTDPSTLSHGVLFWRSFTHWIGGMGVIVLMMAILPAESGRSIHIMRAEMPGPTMGKLVPRLRDTAKTLYLLYIALTVVQFIILWAGDMSWFESALYTFGTAGTGGFGITSDSVGGYSVYSQWVIAIFMVIFGVNFNVYQLIWMRRVRTALRSSELWCYLGIVAGATVVVTINLLSRFPVFSDAVRHAFFQVSSFMTTTGYSTDAFNMWPGLSKTVLLLLMFVGGCAGSTAGGLKVSRVMLLFKSVRRDLQRMVHPRSVGRAHFEGKPVDDNTFNGVGAYFALYAVCLAATFLCLSVETSFSLEATFSSAVSCFNNIGPAYAEASVCYGGYSMVSKIILSLAMLLGRLEIYPLLVMLSPSTWIKKQ